MWKCQLEKHKSERMVHNISLQWMSNITKLRAESCKVEELDVSLLNNDAKLEFELQCEEFWNWTVIASKHHQTSSNKWLKDYLGFRKTRKWRTVYASVLHNGSHHVASFESMCCNIRYTSPQAPTLFVNEDFCHSLLKTIKDGYASEPKVMVFI